MYTVLILLALIKLNIKNPIKFSIEHVKGTYLLQMKLHILELLKYNDVAIVVLYMCWTCLRMYYKRQKWNVSGSELRVVSDASVRPTKKRKRFNGEKPNANPRHVEEDHINTGDKNLYKRFKPGVMDEE